MKISVIGTGTMGSGIVLAFAQAGFNVVMKGRSESGLLKGHNYIFSSLSKLVEKGKIESQTMDEITARITETLSYDCCSDSDLVIEALLEDMALKKEVFQTLDSICKPEAILASNTSSLSITEIAASTKKPERVVGMHFFNPAPVMKLVEIIKGKRTSPAIAEYVSNVATNIGKSPVSVNEAPGFVVNRILIPLINEGIGILADGVASRDDIDKAMKLGANHPMGPLALGDLVGLDVVLAIMEVLYQEFGDPKYRPHPLLRKMVRANQLGRKTGIGFYDYRKPAVTPVK